MGRFSNSWSVFKQSLHVLKQDKELLLLPIISSIVGLLAFISFAAPAWFSGLVERAFLADVPDENARYALYGVFFVYYLVSAFIVIYFNAAIMHAANVRLDGGDPNLRTAFHGPNAVLGRIFLWAIFFATVGLLIRIIENAIRERAGALAGSLFGWIAGAAWWMATYFAVPVVLFEGKHVGPALKRSSGLFKQRWGESLIGHFGLGLALGLLAFVGVLFILAGVGLAMAVLPALGIAVAILGVLWLLFVNLALGPALQAIYKAALYRYASKGEVSPYFTPNTISGAWTAKGGAPTSNPTWKKV